MIVEGDIEKGEWKKGIPNWKVTAKIELRGPVKSEKRHMVFLREPPPEGKPVRADVVAKIEARVKKAGIELPRTVASGDAPAAGEVATVLAAKVAEAAMNGESRIDLDLKQYAHLKKDHPAVLGTVRRLGAIVHDEMTKARAALPKDQRDEMPPFDGVGAVTVTFGVTGASGLPVQGGTVELPANP